MSYVVTNACKSLALPAPQKCVLMCIADRADEEGLSWFSLPSICEWTCFSRTAVIHAVKALENAGLIHVERATGRNNRITVLLQAVANQCSTRTRAPGAPVRQKHPTRAPDAPPPVRQTDGSGAPDAPETSIHQEDIRETVAGGTATVPGCPHRELLALFGKHLPELPQPRPELWATSKNADAMRARWRWVLTAEKEDGERYATTTPEGIAFFNRFFEHVAGSDFLTGRNDRWHGCDLGWLMKAANFEKVVQGNYDNKTEPTAARREYA